MSEFTFLFMGAEPNDQSDLGHGDELRLIKQGIAYSKYRDLVRIEVELSAAAEEFTQHIIYYQPDILHLSFHGDIHEIYFKSDVTGKSQGVPLEAFQLLGQACKTSVKLMVLSCCQSDYIAQELAKSIDFVIGMKESITVEAASHFARAFYNALCSGSTVQQAFDFGRTQIAALGECEEDLPVLFSNKDPASEKLFCPAGPMFTEIKLSGSALELLFETDNGLREVRAHSIGEPGIKFNFDITNLGRIDLKIDQLFVEVVEYVNLPCKEVYIFLD